MTLKEQLFNEETVTMLADRLETVYPSLDTSSFIQACTSAFKPLELKARMSHVRKQLHTFLSDDFRTTLELFYKAFEQTDQGHFIYGSVLEYIEVYGCTDEHADVSIKALGDLTHILSSEFAIRPFLNHYPEMTMKYVMEWTQSPNVHKRRLASEGTRPLLPWAGKITLDYRLTEPVLDTLYDDSEQYVVRSVSNHLNDISKIDPNFVIRKLKEWKTNKNKTSSTIEYIDHHSLRTLLKQGYPAAMEYMGYSLNPMLKFIDLQLDQLEIKVGSSLQFNLEIETGENVKLMIDYIITYPTKLGKTTTKVYKWKNIDAAGGTRYVFKKKQAFKNMSTRTMRTGPHKISIQINGKIVKNQVFTLVE